MKIVMIYDIPDETVKDFLSSSTHAEDVIDAINDEAIAIGNIEHIWHINDENMELVAILLSTFWDLFYSNTTKDVIDELTD